MVRIPVPLYESGDADHLRNFHAMHLSGLPAKVIDQMHQQHHFDVAMGRAPMLVPHYHTSEHTPYVPEDEEAVTP